MNTNKVVNGVIGKGKQSKMFKDSDGDGIMNVYDCEPNNPKEQGLFDDIKKAASGLRDKAQKFRDEQEFKRDERAAYKEDIERDTRKAEREAYRKEAVKVAAKRGIEKARGTRPSGFAAFTSNVDRISGALVGNTSRPMTAGVRKPAMKYKRIKTVKYVKSGKNYKRKVSYIKKPIKARASGAVRTSMPSNNLSMMLGVGSGNKKGKDKRLIL